MTRRARQELPPAETMLPLKPVEALMMTMLAAGERHGYGLRQDVLEQSGVELEAGTLYRHIRRLESADLIEASSRRPGAGDDDRRIYYRLTPFGRRVLAAEMLRLRDLVRFAEANRIITPSRA
jgi:DNA-binding PadR family transcriptional regulator